MPENPIDRERLLATFLELAAIDGPSRKEGAVARRVRDWLHELGVAVEEDDVAATLGGESGNLLARLPGALDGPTLLFCAHLDTVESTARLRVVREQGVIRSDGTTILGADNKAGVAAIIELLRALKAARLPHPPLEVVFTVAEELGLRGAAAFDYARLSAQCGFVPDVSGDVGAIVVRAPAKEGLRVTVHGRAAHAGVSPELGINAITIAARAIARVRQGRLDEESTANLGAIQGGKATNIVPDRVEIRGEARSQDPAKLEAQLAHMREVFEEEAARDGATVEIEFTGGYPAFRLDETSLPVRLATAALDTLGLPAAVTSTGGGSDANFFNAHGIPTAILSAGYVHPHSVDEALDEAQLVRLAQWLYEIVRLAGNMRE